MKKGLSLFLTLVIVLGVFLSAPFTLQASAVEDASRYKVTTTGFKNGAITFNILLTPNQIIYDAVVSVKFDKTAVTVKSAGPATTTDSSGNKTEVVDGLYASGLSYYNDSCYSFAYTTSKENGYKVGSVEKAIFTITFKALNESVAPTFDFYVGDNDSTVLIVSHKNVSQLPVPEIISTQATAECVEFSWEKISGSASCAILKKIDGEFVKIAVLESTTTSYLDADVVPDTAYTYAIATIDSFGFLSPYSEFIVETLSIGDMKLELNEGGQSYYVSRFNTSVTGELEIPTSYKNLPITKIGDNAFKNCTLLTNVIIGDSVTNIGYSAFYNCTDLTSITIPNSVTNIGQDAFKNCTNLNAVYINDLTSWCKINFYNEQANPLYYAENLYLNGSLVTDLVIPEEITLIKDYTFNFYRTLTSVIIPDSVTSIGGYAFYDCTSLTSVTIPNRVTSIGCDAFAYCEQLKKVNISDVEKWCNINFETGTANPLSNGASLYLDGKIIRNLILPESLTEVKDYTFYGNRLLKSVKLPDTIEKIGVSSFGNCANLELLVMSKNVTDIGDFAFAGCKSLESVVLPKTLKYIGGGAFHKYDVLKYVFYEGSAYDWRKIAIVEDNFMTSDLVIHYNSTDHTYMEVVNEPIFDGVESTREEVCEVCGHVGEVEKIEFLNEYLAGVTTFSVTLDELTKYLSANLSASQNINESFAVIEGYTLNTIPNSPYGFIGTGSKVQVIDENGMQVDEYTLVVRGDVNGDSVCDVLDCMLLELARHESNNVSLEGVYFAAGNLAEDNEINIDDVKAVVNKALALA